MIYFSHLFESLFEKRLIYMTAPAEKVKPIRRGSERVNIRPKKNGFDVNDIVKQYNKLEIKGRNSRIVDIIKARLELSEIKWKLGLTRLLKTKKLSHAEKTSIIREYMSKYVRVSKDVVEKMTEANIVDWEKLMEHLDKLNTVNVVPVDVEITKKNVTDLNSLTHYARTLLIDLFNSKKISAADINTLPKFLDIDFDTFQLASQDVAIFNKLQEIARAKKNANNSAKKFPRNWLKEQWSRFVLEAQCASVAANTTKPDLKKDFPAKTPQQKQERKVAKRVMDFVEKRPLVSFGIVIAGATFLSYMFSSRDVRTAKKRFFGQIASYAKRYIVMSAVTTGLATAGYYLAKNGLLGKWAQGWLEKKLGKERVQKMMKNARKTIKKIRKIGKKGAIKSARETVKKTSGKWAEIAKVRLQRSKIREYFMYKLDLKSTDIFKNVDSLKYSDFLSDTNTSSRIKAFCTRYSINEDQLRTVRTFLKRNESKFVDRALKISVVFYRIYHFKSKKKTLSKPSLSKSPNFDPERTHRLKTIYEKLEVKLDLDDSTTFSKLGKININFSTFLKRTTNTCVVNFCKDNDLLSDDVVKIRKYLLLNQKSLRKDVSKMSINDVLLLIKTDDNVTKNSSLPLEEPSSSYIQDIEIQDEEDVDYNAVYNYFFSSLELKNALFLNMVGKWSYSRFDHFTKKERRISLLAKRNQGVFKSDISTVRLFLSKSIKELMKGDSSIKKKKITVRQILLAFYKKNNIEDKTSKIPETENADKIRNELNDFKSKIGSTAYYISHINELRDLHASVVSTFNHDGAVFNGAFLRKIGNWSFVKFTYFTTKKRIDIFREVFFGRMTKNKADEQMKDVRKILFFIKKMKSRISPNNDVGKMTIDNIWKAFQKKGLINRASAPRLNAESVQQRVKKGFEAFFDPSSYSNVRKATARYLKLADGKATFLSTTVIGNWSFAKYLQAKNSDPSFKNVFDSLPSNIQSQLFPDDIKKINAFFFQNKELIMRMDPIPPTMMEVLVRLRKQKIIKDKPEPKSPLSSVFQDLLRQIKTPKAVKLLHEKVRVYLGLSNNKLLLRLGDFPISSNLKTNINKATTEIKNNFLQNLLLRIKDLDFNLIQKTDIDIFKSFISDNADQIESLRTKYNPRTYNDLLKLMEYNDLIVYLPNPKYGLEKSKLLGKQAMKELKEISSEESNVLASLKKVTHMKKGDERSKYIAQIIQTFSERKKKFDSYKKTLLSDVRETYLEGLSSFLRETTADFSGWVNAGALDALAPSTSFDNADWRALKNAIFNEDDLLLSKWTTNADESLTILSKFKNGNIDPTSLKKLEEHLSDFYKNYYQLEQGINGFNRRNFDSYVVDARSLSIRDPFKWGYTYYVKGILGTRDVVFGKNSGDRGTLEYWFINVPGLYGGVGYGAIYNGIWKTYKSGTKNPLKYLWNVYYSFHTGAFRGVASNVIAPFKLAQYHFRNYQFTHAISELEMINKDARALISKLNAEIPNTTIRTVKELIDQKLDLDSVRKLKTRANNLYWYLRSRPKVYFEKLAEGKVIKNFSPEEVILNVGKVVPKWIKKYIPKSVASLGIKNRNKDTLTAIENAEAELIKNFGVGTNPDYTGIGSYESPTKGAKNTVSSIKDVENVGSSSKKVDTNKVVDEIFSDGNNTSKNTSEHIPENVPEKITKKFLRKEAETLFSRRAKNISSTLEKFKGTNLNKPINFDLGHGRKIEFKKLNGSDLTCTIYDSIGKETLTLTADELKAFKDGQIPTRVSDALDKISGARRVIEKIKGLKKGKSVEITLRTGEKVTFSMKNNASLFRSKLVNLMRSPQIEMKIGEKTVQLAKEEIEALRLGRIEGIKEVSSVVGESLPIGSLEDAIKNQIEIANKANNTKLSRSLGKLEKSFSKLPLGDKLALSESDAMKAFFVGEDLQDISKVSKMSNELGDLAKFSRMKIAGGVVDAAFIGLYLYGFISYNKSLNNKNMNSAEREYFTSMRDQNLVGAIADGSCLGIMFFSETGSSLFYTALGSSLVLVGGGLYVNEAISETTKEWATASLGVYKKMSTRELHHLLYEQNFINHSEKVSSLASQVCDFFFPKWVMSKRGVSQDMIRKTLKPAIRQSILRAILWKDVPSGKKFNPKNPIHRGLALRASYRYQYLQQQSKNTYKLGNPFESAKIVSFSKHYADMMLDNMTIQAKRKEIAKKLFTVSGVMNIADRFILQRLRGDWNAETFESEMQVYLEEQTENMASRSMVSQWLEQIRTKPQYVLLLKQLRNLDKRYEFFKEQTLVKSPHINLYKSNKSLREYDIDTVKETHDMVNEYIALKKKLSRVSLSEQSPGAFSCLETTFDNIHAESMKESKPFLMSMQYRLNTLRDLIKNNDKKKIPRTELLELIRISKFLNNYLEYKQSPGNLVDYTEYNKNYRLQGVGSAKMIKWFKGLENGRYRLKNEISILAKHSEYKEALLNKNTAILFYLAQHMFAYRGKPILKELKMFFNEGRYNTFGFYCDAKTNNWYMSRKGIYKDVLLGNPDTNPLFFNQLIGTMQNYKTIIFEQMGDTVFRGENEKDRGYAKYIDAMSKNIENGFAYWTEMQMQKKPVVKSVEGFHDYLDELAKNRDGGFEFWKTKDYFKSQKSVGENKKYKKLYDRALQYMIALNKELILMEKDERKNTMEYKRQKRKYNTYMAKLRENRENNEKMPLLYDLSNIGDILDAFRIDNFISNKLRKMYLELASKMPGEKSKNEQAHFEQICSFRYFKKEGRLSNDAKNRLQTAEKLLGKEWVLKLGRFERRFSRVNMLKLKKMKIEQYKKEIEKQVVMSLFVSGKKSKKFQESIDKLSLPEITMGKYHAYGDTESRLGYALLYPLESGLTIKMRDTLLEFVDLSKFNRYFLKKIKKLESRSTDLSSYYQARNALAVILSCREGVWIKIGRFQISLDRVNKGQVDMFKKSYGRTFEYTQKKGWWVKN